ncbi:hypothetical protein SO802_002151 [Lithocarpus litseifolius]|uniref:FBD domain-containing protein n=1 Tax=Lithocarpus litseifolius TaxID=425828 RepID=A0AAW2DWD2_9ROSI
MNICERFLFLRNGRKLSWLCVHSKFIENRTESSRAVTRLHMAIGCDVENLHNYDPLTISSENVQCLSLSIEELDDYLIRAMTSLLRRFPKLKALESLDIKYSLPRPTTTMSGFDTVYWQSQHLVFIHQLESVSIELHNGENELELVIYILEHAKKLKEMVIFYSLPLPSGFISRIGIDRMSSSPVVVLKNI